MNAIPPISQAPRSSDSAQPDGSESAPQTPSAGADFARVLSDAGGKPARKHAAIKHHDGSGGSALPAPGNQPPLAHIAPPLAPIAPPLAPIAPPVTQSPAAVQPTDGNLPAASAPAAVIGADSGSGKQAGNMAAQPITLPTGPAGQALADMATLAAAAPAPATPADAGSAFALANTPVTANDNHATSVPAAPPTEGPKSGASPAGAALARPAAALTTVESDAKPTETRSSKAQIAAAASGQTSTDASAPAGDPVLADGTAAAATAAQSLIANAMARDTSTSPASSAPADDPATPDTGVSTQDVAAANAATASASAIASAAHAAAASSAAGSAATAASFAQAMLASAGAGTAGKHHDNDTDNSASGIPNDGSTGAAQLLTSNSSADAAPVPTFKVTAGVDTPEFGQGLADRVSLMMDSNLTSAKLQVNPPALGPIEVRIALQGGHAQVWLSSHSAVTRDALESSAPKLREMLGAQGFGQVSVDISQRSFQERSPQPQHYEALPALRELPGIAQTSMSMAHIPSGLLDAYA